MEPYRTLEAATYLAEVLVMTQGTEVLYPHDILKLPHHHWREPGVAPLLTTSPVPEILGCLKSD